MSTQIVKTENPGRKRYAESERRELLRKYGRSGMTQAAFCRANGLTTVTLSKWLCVRVAGIRFAPFDGEQIKHLEPLSG